MKKTISVFAISAAITLSSVAQAQTPVFDEITCRTLTDIINQMYDAGAAESNRRIQPRRVHSLRILAQDFAVEATGQYSASFIHLAGEIAEIGYKLGNYSNGDDEFGVYKMKRDSVLEDVCPPKP